METLAFASQLMTILYNEVSPFTHTSSLPLHYACSPHFSISKSLGEDLKNFAEEGK